MDIQTTESLINNPILGIALIAATAFLIYIFYLKPRFSKTVQTNDDANHKASNGLISILQNTVDVLEERMTKKDGEIKEMSERLKILEKEHDVLKDIFKERDPESTKFREKGFEAFEKLSFINDNIVHTNTKLISVENTVNKIRNKIAPTL